MALVPVVGWYVEQNRIKAEKGGRPMETLEQRERKLREKLERLSQSKFPVIQKHAGKCLQLLGKVQKEGGEVRS